MSVTDRQRVVVQRLTDALKHAGDTHTLPDLMAALRAGEAQCWDHNGSLAVTEILTYPQRVVLRLWLAAGTFDDLTELLPDIEAWGRQHGATLVEAIGRRGWMKVARAHDYEPTAMIYRKELQP